MPETTEGSSTANFESGDSGFWTAAAEIYRYRRFIVVVTGLAAIASVIISLLIPKQFTAATSLMVPEESKGSLSALLSNDLASAATSFLRGSSGDFARYLTILQSRTLREAVVDEFDLITAYDLADADHPREDAIGTLGDKTVFTIDNEYDFLSVKVTDSDPQRASDMANFMAAELNRMNARLSSESASNFRSFVERRYRQAGRERDSLLAAIQNFQEEFGVFDLEVQSQAFFENVAVMRANLLEAEINYEALRTQLGPNNAEVRSAESFVRAARRKYNQAMAGSEAILPVAQDTIPAVARQYANLELDRVIQTRVIEVLAPLVEQAKFDEMLEIESVQVVDAAVPPIKKSHPKRPRICIMITLSAFILAILFVLFRQVMAHFRDITRQRFAGL